MGLKSLVITDTLFKNTGVGRFLEISKVDVITNDKYRSNLDSSFSLLPYDLIIIAIKAPDQAIFITEQIYRLSPEVKTAYLFESSANFSHLFGSTMKQMVDWMISYDNIDNLLVVIDEIFNEKYTIIKRAKHDIIFTERELSIIKLIQMDIDSLEIQSLLNISGATFNRCLGDCAIKMECKGRGSVGVRSFSILGDLRD